MTLVALEAKLHKAPMAPTDIFSRAARRNLNDRAYAADDDDRWISNLIANELIERLGQLEHPYDRVLIVGNDRGNLRTQFAEKAALVVIADVGFRAAAATSGVQCDEDRLPFANNSFDVVFAPGGLDSVNDLPGALRLICKTLAPGGLFLGAMAGAGGLETLRRILMLTEDPLQTVARLHPQIDVRAAGDLLARAGFDRPVAEQDFVNARYSSLLRLIGDVRANGLTNVLVDRKPLKRRQLTAMAAYFAKPDGGKTDEIFSLIYMTGWSPAPRAGQLNR